MPRYPGPQPLLFNTFPYLGCTRCGSFPRWKTRERCLPCINKAKTKRRRNHAEAKDAVWQKQRATAKQWKKDNPEKVKFSKRMYKRGLRTGRNDFTEFEWYAMLVISRNRCYYCGEDMQNDPTRDHVIPISRGGENTKNNIVPACRMCNSRKQERLVFP